MKKVENLGAKSAFLMSLAASVALAACGGGSGGGTSSTTTSTVSGTATKGDFEQGTKVYCYPATSTSADAATVTATVTGGTGANATGAYSCTGITWTGPTMVEIDSAGTYYEALDGTSHTADTPMKMVTTVPTAGNTVTASPSLMSTLGADYTVNLLNEGTSTADALETGITAGYNLFMGNDDVGAALPYDYTVLLALDMSSATDTVVSAIEYRAETLDLSYSTADMVTLITDTVSALKTGNTTAAVATAKAAVVTAPSVAQLARLETQRGGTAFSAAVRANPKAAVVAAKLDSTGYTGVGISADGSLTSSTGSGIIYGNLTVSQGLSVSGGVTSTITVAASAKYGTVTLGDSSTSGSTSVSFSATNDNTISSGYTFGYTPDSTTRKSDIITLTATASKGGSTKKAFAGYANTALVSYPVKSEPTVQESKTADTLSVSLAATDADGDTLSYYISENARSWTMTNSMSDSRGTYGGYFEDGGYSFSGGLTTLKSIDGNYGFTFTGATSTTTTGIGHWKLSGSTVSFEPAFSTTVTAAFGFAVIDSKGYGIINEFRIYGEITP